MLFERLPCDTAPLTPFFPDAVIHCVRGRQAAQSVRKSRQPGVYGLRQSGFMLARFENSEKSPEKGSEYFGSEHFAILRGDGRQDYDSS
jgi:hypothetical protein